MQGEKLSADMPAAGDFVTSFQKFIEDNNYTLNQIFNCDETGLYYKLLPEKTLASSFEKSASGRKKQLRLMHAQSDWKVQESKVLQKY